MADLRCRMHRADHGRAVKGLTPVPGTPLFAGLQLQIPAGQIIADGIAPDVFQRLVLGDGGATGADGDDQLGLVVEVPGFGG